MERRGYGVRRQAGESTGGAGGCAELLYFDGGRLRPGYGRDYPGKAEKKCGKVSGGEGLWQ